MKRMIGTTLIEAMISMLILTGGMLAIARLQGEIAASNTLAKQRTEAGILAQDLIEQYRNFGRVEATAGYTDYASIGSGSDAVEGINATYNRMWTVAEDISPGFKTVTVTIMWVGATRVNQQISISTVIGGHDPANIANFDNSIPAPKTP